MEKLVVVIPVFNEASALPTLYAEWKNVLERVCPSFELLFLNDGSTDATPSILHALASGDPHLRVIDKVQEGHGQTCMRGYREALADGATWVFQIDSDGQCDPQYFETFWRQRERYPVQYGLRRKREDGFQRTIVSYVVSVVVFLATGVWLRDANVPYRLMRADTILALLPRVPGSFHLANIQFAVQQRRAYSIHWNPIGFRERCGGVPSIRTVHFLRKGWELFWELRRAR